MLVVRDFHIVKVDGKLFVHQPSNQLLLKLISLMGKISVLSWVKEESAKEDALVPLVESDKLEVIEIPDNLSIQKKIKSIKKVVRDADSLSLKFCFIDSFIACHYAIKYKKPFIIESGAYAFASLWHHGGSIKYKLASFPINWLAKHYHAKAKDIIYVSKHYLQNRYPSKANQIGCSDAILPDVSSDVLESRMEKINGMTDITLGLVGNTSVQYRGHDTLIEVMALLRKKGYNVCVRFAGSSNGKKERLQFARELYVEDNVFFDGLLDQEGIFNWIDNIDILVMPTLAETLGRSILEGMSRGCPVVGSQETAIPEQIGSDCIAPARDVSAISNIIEHMIIDREYMKLCARENFWRAKKYNSEITDKVRKQFYNDFYERNEINQI